MRMPGCHRRRLMMGKGSGVPLSLALESMLCGAIECGERIEGWTSIELTGDKYWAFCAFRALRHS